MKKIVFLPTSPNMWDGFETLWDSATSDPENQVVVIPIPTYKRDSQNNLYDMNYVTDGYPEYVTITDINSYSLSQNHPDIIYIQNVQDFNNYGFCVHPAFHTTKLKDYTPELVYVPYMCTRPISFDNKPYLDNIKCLFISPGIYNVNRIIVQSQNQKEIYMYYLASQNPYLIDYWSERITYEDYPRNMIIRKYSKEHVRYPAEWDSLLKKHSGIYKKSILLCTSVMEMLSHGRRIIIKLKKTFDEHLKNNDPSVLIWRPYPAIENALVMLRPELVEEFKSLLEFYNYNQIGILDQTPSPTAAIVLSDEYWGSCCGIMELFRTTGKPIIQWNDEL